MKASTILVSCAAAATASLATTIPSSPHTAKIPTSYESAVLGRRILALTPLATVSTVFPSDSNSESSPSTRENRPPGLGGMPHGLMEYVADCDTSDSGNPTILAISVETSFKNAAAGSNVSVSIQWTPPHPPAKRIQGGSWLGRAWEYLVGGYDRDEEVGAQIADPSTYSAANLPRFSLLGYVERIEGGDENKALAKCFVKAHPDARYWLPGNRIHESHFVRLVVEEVYWIGGFGDRAFIGWIPVEEWNAVTKAEWGSVRLPGEKKGWKEWSVDL